MANRHSHKKLRAEILSRMARTGERYQAAREHIVTRSQGARTEVDLVPFRFFGVPMTLATAEGGLVHSIAVLGRPRSTRSFPLPFVAWLSPEGVN
jgi:hypothetical protein